MNDRVLKIAITGYHVRQLDDLIKLSYDAKEDCTYAYINLESLAFFDYVMNEVRKNYEKAYPENL